MAQNPVPTQVDQMFTLAEDMADGLNSHEVAVGVKQNKEADVRAVLTAAQTAENLYQTARSFKTTQTAAQTLADSNAKAFIATSKRVLENYLGAQWSNAWVTAGFVNGSTAIPRTIEERQACLTALKNYFTANAAHENAPLSVTAALANAQFTALSGARSAVNDAATAAGTAKATRDTAVATLGTRMRGLIAELSQLLAADDPRWYAFGLSRPSDAQTPGVPDGLVLTPGTPGSVNADWADARRAARYRVFRQIIGTDPDFVHVATVTDSDATVNSFTSGMTVKVRVTAANDAGESQPSAEVQIVVP